MKTCAAILLILCLVPACWASTDGKATFSQVDSVAVLEYRSPQLFNFYKQNNFNLAWSRESNRKLAIALISDAAADGLDPKDYNIGRLIAIEAKSHSLFEEERAAYDVLMTFSLQKFLRRLSSGKLDPRKVYRNWDLQPNDVDINSLLLGALSGDSLSNIVRHARPPHAMYGKLLRALEIIDVYPKDNYRIIDINDRKLRRNMSDSALIAIKQRLIYWKDMPPKKKLTPLFDNELLKAVKSFQSRHGLNPDGVIGKKTIEALNFSRNQRRRQIIANLERWRWFPRDPGGHYFLVNIPDYLLTIVRDGDTIQYKRVVVGKEDRKTPVLSSYFSDIVLNPTWTLPPTVIKEDLTPDASRNRKYFEKRNIRIYDFSGNEISPDEWKPWRSTKYRYVQSPGAHNSLGVVKFNFPNNHLVYLHDTNIKSLFKRSNRSLSSGCTRVQDPLPLAEYVLNDPYWTLDSISKIIEAGATVTIPIKEKIAFHQLYWTAWSEGDLLIFREDIYKLDENLYRKLRN